MYEKDVIACPFDLCPCLFASSPTSYTPTIWGWNCIIKWYLCRMSVRPPPIKIYLPCHFLCIWVPLCHCQYIYGCSIRFVPLQEPTCLAFDVSTPCILTMAGSTPDSSNVSYLITILTLLSSSTPRDFGCKQSPCTHRDLREPGSLLQICIFHLYFYMSTSEWQYASFKHSWRVESANTISLILHDHLSFRILWLGPWLMPDFWRSLLHPTLSNWKLVSLQGIKSQPTVQFVLTPQDPTTQFNCLQWGRGTPWHMASLGQRRWGLLSHDTFLMTCCDMPVWRG
jgi:hypothetical protein